MISIRHFRLQELMANVRHYSNLRFAMLTVFFAVNGGLLMTFFDCDFAANHPGLGWLFEAAGTLITLAFFIFEAALNSNLSKSWEAISLLVDSNDYLVRHRQPWKSRWVPAATFGIFIGTCFFWLLIASHYYPGCG